MPDKIYFSPRELVSKGLISKSAGNRIRGGKGDFSPQTQPDLTAVSTLGLSPLHWAQATFMMQTFPSLVGSKKLKVSHLGPQIPHL